MTTILPLYKIPEVYSQKKMKPRGFGRGDINLSEDWSETLGCKVIKLNFSSKTLGPQPLVIGLLPEFWSLDEIFQVGV